jgi:hypothetical protein
MFKKILSLTLVALLLNVLLVSPARAGAQVVGQTPNAEKVRESIRKLGTGDAARVELKLWDGKKLRGYIRDAGQESFVVTDEKTGAFETVAYSQVKQVKGHNNLTAAKVGLTLAKGAAIVGAVALAFTLLILVTVPKT